VNIAVIFAGGNGTRMKHDFMPKQFLEIENKPIIIHTLEVFNNNKEINGIVIACNPQWIDFCHDLICKFKIDKVIRIVKGGITGQLSIYNCLKSIINNSKCDDIVLIHDGVRPFINDDIIYRNIISVKEFGSAITCVPAKETSVILGTYNNINEIKDRNSVYVAKAPQSFFLKDIFSVHEQALNDGIDNSIDSCSLMYKYNRKLFVVYGEYENIKITTQEDFYTAQALFKFRKAKNTFGCNYEQI
jgi:2-C-methyl-D-erythritol 4-phosphate cytidylyltransferase